MIFNSNFQIHFQALAIGNILNTKPQPENKNIQTFPFYNGREYGICLLVAKNPTSNKVLAINFGRNRNTDSLFVQTTVRDRPFNAPSVESKTFNEESYATRILFKFDDYEGAANLIMDFINGYEG